MNPEPYGTPFTRIPKPEDAVIYQVNPRAFSESANFQGVTERLDSIQALGANVIYLLPIHPVGQIKTVNSPFCIRDYDSVAEEFGTLEDLRQLIDGAHSRNMAVILDWVANHTAWDHPWIKTKSWYLQDAEGNIISPLNTGWNDVAALDYGNPDVRKAMIKAMKDWVYRANIDGFRCDAADFVPADFWTEALRELCEIPGRNLFLFAEGTRNDLFSSGFQLRYGMESFETLKEVMRDGKSVKTLDTLIQNSEKTKTHSEQQIVRYTTNHDVNRTDGTPEELFGGASGALAAFVVSAFQNCVPMIYNGQEIGYPKRLDYFSSSTTIHWPAHSLVTDTYRDLLAFRQSSKALKNGTYTSFSSDDVCAFQMSTSSETVLVLVNLRNHPVRYSIPNSFLQSTVRMQTVPIDRSELVLAPCISLDAHQFAIFKSALST